MKFEKEALLTLAGFYELKKGVIDSSSIIYMDRAGYLNIVSASVELFAPEAVFHETGIKPEGIELITSADDRVMSADDLILKHSFNLSMPVISDDRGVLKQAGALGLSYYNSLMMLSYIFWCEAIDHDRYTDLLKRLKSFARYSRKVYEYGEAVEKEILKLHKQ